MSTKIFNGYKLPSMDLLDLMRWLEEVQRQFIACRKEKFIKRFPQILEEIELYLKLQEMAYTIEKTKRRNPSVDFSAEIVILPPMPGKILCLTFWDNPDYDKLWNSFDKVTYYGYWNNIDPDESCSEEEWSQREKDWNTVLPDYSIPAQRGLTFILTDYSLPFPHEYKEAKNEKR